ncbi:hypothetical protein HDE_09771 [Halotydeus destructor]|nr:hypothetical protein HDE_09771 [Halotydeus destructor]
MEDSWFLNSKMYENLREPGTESEILAPILKLTNEAVNGAASDLLISFSYSIPHVNFEMKMAGINGVIPTGYEEIDGYDYKSTDSSAVYNLPVFMQA